MRRVRLSKNFSVVRRITLSAVLLFGYTGWIHAQVAITLNGNGLTDIRWRGTSFLGSGQSAMEHADFCVAGVPQPGDTSAATTVDSVNSTITQRFSWGNVKTFYRPLGDVLTVTVQITNNGSAPLCQFIYRPFYLRFPQTPPELTGGNPLMAFNAD